MNPKNLTFFSYEAHSSFIVLFSPFPSVMQLFQHILHLLRNRQPQMPCILQQAHALIGNIKKDHRCPQHGSVPDL